MGLQRTRRVFSVIGLTGAALILAACGGQAPKTAGGGDSGSEQATKVGIFVDNAFGDGDFFDQAAKAVEPLENDLGATVSTYEGQLQAQNFEPMLQDAADANDLVFVLGFEAIDAMTKVAKDSPDTTFVFVDGVVDSDQVVSAVFRTAEGCFMPGALAATVNESKGSQVAGFIGGVNAPVVKNCESGYKQGVAEVDSKQRVATQYVGSFVDPAKGRETAIALEQAGAYGVFPYAGLSGSGAFDAAKSGIDIAPIGIVTDKSHLAPGKSPGSLEMGVDVVILELTKDFQNGVLEKGSRHDYGFAEGGWKMIYNQDLLTEEQITALKDLEQQIVEKELQVK